MMHPMHIRCNKKQTDKRVNFRRYINIAMVEHGSCIQQYLKNQAQIRRRSEQDNNTYFNGHRQENFQGMESGSGCYINIKVSIVETSTANARKPGYNET